MFRFVGEFVFASPYYHIWSAQRLCMCIACVAAYPAFDHAMRWMCNVCGAVAVELLGYVACMASMSWLCVADGVHACLIGSSIHRLLD